MNVVLLIAAACGAIFAQQPSPEIERWKAAVEANPGSAEAHARLGFAYQNAGRLHEAAAALEKSLALQPDLPRVPTLLAFVYISVGRYADAVPLLRRMFDLERDAEMRALVGQRLVECLFTTGGEEEALDIIAKLRVLKPDDPNVLYLAAKAHANLWNSTVQRLLETSAESYRARQILAEVLETQERYSEAAAEYRAIIQLQPRMPGFHYRLGRMLMRADPSPQGEEAALAEFRAELGVNPFDVPSHVEIGELELKAGRKDEARQHFSRAAALQPGNATAQLGLARALMAAGQHEKALESLAAAERLAPKNEAVLYQKMLALRSLGRRPEALEAQAAFQKLKSEKERSVSSIRERLKSGAPTPGLVPDRVR